MFSTFDSWLGLGIVLIIGLVVVGLAACLGTLIIRLFGTKHEATATAGRDKAPAKSDLHETA
ncbi:MAG TPA: hypothetical protein VF078_03305 [Nitrospira sp.]